MISVADITASDAARPTARPLPRGPRGGEHERAPESDPRHATGKIKQMLDDLEKHLREDVKDVPEPRAQALFETTAEVVTGLKTAYDHYERGSEEAWRRRGATDGVTTPCAEARSSVTVFGSRIDIVVGYRSAP